MGFFKNLFRKKDDTDYIFESVRKNAKKIEKSFNYHYVFKGLKYIFLEVEDMNKLYNNKTETTFFLEKCAIAISQQYNLPAYKDFPKIKYYFGIGENGRSIIIEFPGPFKCECECNFVALMELNNKTKCIYSSEYYIADNNFGLCFESDDKRYFLSGNPKTLDEFCGLIKQHIVK